MNRVETLANNNEKFLIEVHMLRNLPASHINADDVGSLKSVVFGGTERARISSQCIKNAWRKSETIVEYSNNLSVGERSYRTRQLASLVLDYMKENYGYTDDKGEIVSKLVAKIVGSEKGVVCFISTEDIKFIAYVVDEKIKSLSEKEIKKIIETKTENKSTKTEDKTSVFKKGEVEKLYKKYVDANGIIIPAIINIFGRMSTAEAIMTIDSAVQVAHAISTHEVTQESDYFTAVDDVSTEEVPSGSGHLSETMFNSACYYQYMNFSVNQFCKNMMDTVTDEEYREQALANVVKTLLETVCMENPKTKQSSFASSTFPECIYVAVKKRNIPSTYCNAYADAVKSETGMISNSVKKLADEIDVMSVAYPIETVGKFWMAPRYTDVVPNTAEKVDSLSELIEKVSECIK